MHLIIRSEPNLCMLFRHFHPTEVVEEPQTEPDTTTCAVDDKGTRKLLFKKRSTSSTCAVNLPRMIYTQYLLITYIVFL